MHTHAYVDRKLQELNPGSLINSGIKTNHINKFSIHPEKAKKLYPRKSDMYFMSILDLMTKLKLLQSSRIYIFFCG